MESWVSHALPGAVAYASSLLGDRTSGEEVVQDCVCRLLAHAARYDLPRDGRKLLFRSITNACINRRTRARKTLSLDSAPRDEQTGAWNLVDRAADSPPALAMAAELSAAIAEGLSKLPLRQRSALELSSMGYRADEIAEMLGVAPPHVRVLLFRARKAMAGLLNARFFGEVSK